MEAHPSFRRREPRNLLAYLRENTSLATLRRIRLRAYESLAADIANAQLSQCYSDYFDENLADTDAACLLRQGQSGLCGFEGIMINFKSRIHREGAKAEASWTSACSFGDVVRKNKKATQFRRDFTSVKNTSRSAGFIIGGAHRSAGIALPGDEDGVSVTWNAVDWGHGTGFSAGADGTARARGGANGAEGTGTCVTRKARATLYAHRQAAGLGRNLLQRVEDEEAVDMEEGGDGGVVVHRFGVAEWPIGMMLI